jgi:hypothetical protein
MDRHVVNSTLSTLVKREHLRKTSVVGVKGDRHDIYYFPTFTLESPEMVEFLDKTLNKKEVIPHWDKFDRANDIVIDELSQRIGDVGQPDQSQGGAKGGEGISANGRRGGGAFPGPGDDPATVKDYFRRQSIVVGASYGARYGPYSRARQLHKWLASITYSGESSPLIAHKDDDGFVLTHDTFVSAMPLVIFTSIVPLPIESDELRQFLDDPSHLSLPLSLVPSNILSVLRPSLNKRKQAVWNTISTLMKFKLLSPLVEASGPSRSQRSFVTPVQAQSATHWRFNTTVPVYSFAQDEAPLVSLANLDSVDAVRQYWTSLQRYATILIDPLPMEEPAKLEGSGYPLKFDGIGAFVKRLRLKSKWKDGYHFLPDQRKFLTNLVTTDPNLVNSNQDRSNEIEVWADALFAPVNVVVEYLQSVESKARQTVEAELNPSRRKKKRRVTKSQGGGGGGGGVGDDEWEEVEEGGVSADAAATALHRKVQEIAAQRERDWTTIVDKFRADHQQPPLDPNILGYLQRRFLDPRRQIDAVQLLFELRQLLPEPPPLAAEDETLRSVVPHNLRRLARQAKDPYNIAQQPNIRKRVRSQVTKSRPTTTTTTAPRSSASAGGGGGASGRPSMIGARSSPQPIEYGTQDEFLSQPAIPRPDTESGRRVRNFYTSEQDELLLDAVAVLKARMKKLSTRIQYGVLERLFKGHKASVLRSRSMVLLKKPEEQIYHDRLVEAWLKVYEQRKDTDENLQDPNEGSMTDFDIASFIRCLRQHVNKRAM